MKFITAILLSVFMSCSYAQVSTENITPPKGKVPLRVLGTTDEDAKSCNADVTKCVLLTPEALKFIQSQFEKNDKQEDEIKQLMHSNEQLMKALKMCVNSTRI